jgi:hypothetical protein
MRFFSRKPKEEKAPDRKAIREMLKVVKKESTVEEENVEDLVGGIARGDSG